MKVEIRKTGGKPSHQLILRPTKKESKLIDEALGSKVGEDGLISVVAGQVRLSDGYGEHYILLEKNIDFE